jgi:hypothetical protein
MKPLVYYCRWQGAKLRLQGRDETAVWGQLVFAPESGRAPQNFHFSLRDRRLTLQRDGDEQTLQLDEMGVVAPE